MKILVLSRSVWCLNRLVNFKYLVACGYMHDEGPEIIHLQSGCLVMKISSSND